jgi:LysM repeat protein
VNRIPLLVLAVGLVVSLVGCTPSSHQTGSSPQPVLAKAVPVPDGVVGDGTLTGWNGRTSGSLQVIAKSGHFTFVLSDFATDFAGENEFALADTPVTMSQCGENNLWQTGLTDGDNTSKPTMRFSLPNVGGAWGDPSFFQTFLFMQYPTGESLTRGCQQPIIALATIHWTMKSIYPGLTVHDRGIIPGAQGVTKAVNGKPYSYTTIQADAWEDIAKRYGLTPAELLYLNPIRHPEAEPAEAYTGQVLNLSPTNRGDSESRRPGAQ